MSGIVVYVIVGHAGRGADAATWHACFALERAHAVAIRDALQVQADDLHLWTGTISATHHIVTDEIAARRKDGRITDAGFRYDEVGSWYEVVAVGEDPTVEAEHVAGGAERWQGSPTARRTDERAREMVAQLRAWGADEAGIRDVQAAIDRGDIATAIALAQDMGAV